MAKFRVMASGSDTIDDVDASSAEFAAREVHSRNMEELEYGRGYQYFVRDEHGDVTTHALRTSIVIEVGRATAKVTDAVRAMFDGEDAG